MCAHTMCTRRRSRRVPSGIDCFQREMCFMCTHLSEERRGSKARDNVTWPRGMLVKKKEPFSLKILCFEYIARSRSGSSSFTASVLHNLPPLKPLPPAPSLLLLLLLLLLLYPSTSLTIHPDSQSTNSLPLFRVVFAGYGIYWRHESPV